MAICSVIRSIIVFLIAALILTVSIPPLRERAGEAFWTFVGNGLEKEAQERREKIARGELVRDKDTAIIWGNKYEIWHSNGTEILSAHINGSFEFVLLDITEHKRIKDKLYIISDDGYAVIDNANLCRVYITLSDYEFINGHGVDKYGFPKHYGKYIDDSHIKYLADFSEFSEDEQKRLNKLKSQEH